MPCKAKEYKANYDDVYFSVIMCIEGRTYVWYSIVASIFRILSALNVSSMQFALLESYRIVGSLPHFKGFIICLHVLISFTYNHS
jgi:hypothetical protein